ncbi:Hypp4441 [Branchiostoma lanceolatum]|uniref:Hypp4441 protein n=1 Tax=Branchiostoma lanceolatum TaxID=7740 RepID=A0A8K0EY62_BRALA|nr:Hypp4441 [Branchiostoma lanceolatum]
MNPDAEATVLQRYRQAKSRLQGSHEPGCGGHSAAAIPAGQGAMNPDAEATVLQRYRQAKSRLQAELQDQILSRSENLDEEHSSLEYVREKAELLGLEAKNVLTGAVVVAGDYDATISGVYGDDLTSPASSRELIPLLKQLIAMLESGGQFQLSVEGGQLFSTGTGAAATQTATTAHRGLAPLQFAGPSISIGEVETIEGLSTVVPTQPTAGVVQTQLLSHAVPGTAGTAGMATTITQQKQQPELSEEELREKSRTLLERFTREAVQLEDELRAEEIAAINQVIQQVEQEKEKAIQQVQAELKERLRRCSTDEEREQAMLESAQKIQKINEQFESEKQKRLKKVRKELREERVRRKRALLQKQRAEALEAGVDVDETVPAISLPSDDELDQDLMLLGKQQEQLIAELNKAFAEELAREQEEINSGRKAQLDAEMEERIRALNRQMGRSDAETDKLLEDMKKIYFHEALMLNTLDLNTLDLNTLDPNALDLNTFDLTTLDPDPAIPLQQSAAQRGQKSNMKDRMRQRQRQRRTRSRADGPEIPEGVEQGSEEERLILEAHQAQQDADDQKEEEALMAVIDELDAEDQRRKHMETLDDMLSNSELTEEEKAQVVARYMQQAGLVERRFQDSLDEQKDKLQAKLAARKRHREELAKEAAVANELDTISKAQDPLKDADKAARGLAEASDAIDQIREKTGADAAAGQAVEALHQQQVSEQAALETRQRQEDREAGRQLDRELENSSVAVETQMEEQKKLLLDQQKAQFERDLVLKKKEQNLTEDQVKQMLAAHAQEIEKVTENMDKEKERQKNTLAKKLEERKRQKAAQLAEKHQAEMGQVLMQQQQDRENLATQQLLDHEKSTLVDSIQGQDGKKAENIIYRVLKQRHLKETVRLDEQQRREAEAAKAAARAQAAERRGQEKDRLVSQQEQVGGAVSCYIHGGKQRQQRQWHEHRPQRGGGRRGTGWCPNRNR